MITPVKEKMTSLELDKASYLIRLGAEAGCAAIPEIKKAMGQTLF